MANDDLSDFSGNIGKANRFLAEKVLPWAASLACRGDAATMLLAGIFVSMRDIVEALSFGNTYYRITPVPLTAGADPVLICDTQPQGRVRKLSLWVDASSGGPLPTIRISTGASGTSSGGIRIPAGQVSELGEIPASVRLYAASSSTIPMYVIERA